MRKGEWPACARPLSGCTAKAAAPVAAPARKLLREQPFIIAPLCTLPMRWEGNGDLAPGAGLGRRSNAVIPPRTSFCSNTELTLPIAVYLCQAELSKIRKGRAIGRGKRSGWATVV